MRTAMYLYRVGNDQTADFLRIQREAAARYLAHGALSDVTAPIVDAESKYGCCGLADAIEVGAGEQLFIGLTEFRDRAHQDEVMAKVDADPEIDRLFGEISALLDVSRIIRAEFDTGS